MKIKISAEKPAQIPKQLKDKWLKALSKVKLSSDRTTIIFLGEILELLSNEKASFSCVGTVDYDMFSSCDFSWTLSACRFSITREIFRKISESGQRVEVEKDEVKISGMNNYKFSWNGECGETLSTLKIEMETRDLDLMLKIEELGKSLFEDFTIN
jgi:hypothetical protein